jgi:F-type H+-transporting ATPase subunit c
LVPDFEQGLLLNFTIMEANYLPFALIGVVGSGVGIGLIGMAAMQAIGRNPAASNDISAKMLTAIALCEVPGLLAFAALFIIK